MKKVLLGGLILLILTGLAGWFVPRLLIAGIALLIIIPLLMLLVPVRLQARGGCRNTDCQARFQGSWLFSMIHFRFDWDSTTEGTPSLRLLGWELLEE